MKKAYTIDSEIEQYQDPYFIPKSECIVTNIIPAHRMKRIFKLVLQYFEDTVGHTLGPRGTYNMIMNPFMLPRVYDTKDGNDGNNALKFSEATPNCIKDTILEVTRFMQKRVGDGTTSGYPILKVLYNQIQDKLDEDEVFKTVSAGGLECIFDEIYSYFEKNIFFNYDICAAKLEKFTDEEKIDIIKMIASISANNNPDIAKNVSEMFINKLKAGEETGVDIMVKVEDDDNDEIEVRAGFQLPYGHNDETFANQADGMTLKFEKPAFLFIRGIVADSDKEVITTLIRGITDGVFGSAKTDFIRSKKFPTHPLIIVADSFSSNMIAHVSAMANGQMFARPNPDDPERGGEPIHFPVALMSMRCLQGNPEKEKFYDLVCATGGTPIDGVRDKILLPDINTPESFYKHIYPKLGIADEYVGTLYSAKIIGGKGDENSIGERVKYIQKQIESVSKSKQHFTGSLLLDPAEEYYSRIAMLKTNMSRIKVGGINDKIKRRRRAVYDDVVRAVQSTIRKDGFILGGNVNVTWALGTKEKRAEICKIITNTLIEKKFNIVPMLPETTIEERDTSIYKIVESTLDSIFEAFKASYKLSLENAFRDKDITERLYNECINKEKPYNYNIITGEYKSLDLENIESNCSSLLVPINTDAEIMKVTFSTLIELITVGAGLAYYPTNIAFEDYISGLRQQTKQQ